MKRIIPLIFLFITSYLYSQDVFIKGAIIDEETGEGVSFAHIGVCAKSIGTVANENGNYEFRIPNSVLDDTLCATAIGYETFKVPISELKSSTNYQIILKPQISYLNDILIKDEKITGRRVIAKAISRINKNYPRKPFNLKGYYRDYLRKNDEYVSFLEGVLTIDDKGFKHSVDRAKIKIDQLRYSKNYVPYFSEFVKDFGTDSTKLFNAWNFPCF